jgi:outer membrane protein assembly factor BamB
MPPAAGSGRTAAGVNAWFSAPFIGTDGTVVAADDHRVMRVDPATDTVLWKSAKLDSGIPISPAPIGSDLSMVLVATNTNAAGGTAEVSVWDVTTGVLLSHQPIRDPDIGRVYVARNTAAVRGNRAYVPTAADLDPADGRLYAIDVCNASDCGGRGTQSVSWHYDFKGPSGPNPLLIGNVLYFDGRPTRGTGSFMAVADRGVSAKRLWVKLFPSAFGVSAAQDPRGGFWVHSWNGSELLMRLNADTGEIDQQVVVSTAFGLPPGYVAQSAATVGASAAGAVVLTIGAHRAGRSSSR